MNILFITQLLPYPTTSGGQFKTFSILKTLAKTNKIHLVTFHDKNLKAKNAKKLEKLLKIKVKSFYWPVISTESKKLFIKAILSIFSPKPFRTCKYFSTKTANYLKKISKQNHFDIIYFDHTSSFQYLSFINKTSNTKVIYDEHNINSIAMWRKAKSKLTPHKFIFFALDALKYYFYEKKVIKKSDHIFCISKNDLEILIKRGSSKNNLSVLPIPIKTNNLYKTKHKPNILFIGLMSWAPNIHGFWWFYESIYPKIKEKIPNITLTIVGPRPNKKLLNLNKIDKSVTITGQVPFLTPYYKKASVFIAPILTGGGIRIKIINSLAAGIPTTSTTIGTEGIPYQNNKNILIADTPKQFASTIIKIINNKKLAQKLSQNGIRLIKNHYSEKQTQKALNSILCN